MHVVYYLKNPGEELRYSLRSLTNLPVSRLTLIGDVPSWVKGGKRLAGNPTADAHTNSVANAFIAARAFPDEFVLFNDDFYVLQPVDSIPHWWYHTLTAHAGQYTDPRSQHWRKLYLDTARYLGERKVTMPKSFELHVPMRVVGSELDAILTRTAKDRQKLNGPGLWRSLYGNLSAAVQAEGLVRREDVKVHSAREFEKLTDFASTDEVTMRSSVFPLIQKRFSKKSQWEK